MGTPIANSWGRTVALFPTSPMEIAFFSLLAFTAIETASSKLSAITSRYLLLTRRLRREPSISTMRQVPSFIVTARG